MKIRYFILFFAFFSKTVGLSSVFRCRNEFYMPKYPNNRLAPYGPFGGPQSGTVSECLAPSGHRIVGPIWRQVWAQKLQYHFWPQFGTREVPLKTMIPSGFYPDSASNFSEITKNVMRADIIPFDFLHFSGKNSRVERKVWQCRNEFWQNLLDRLAPSEHPLAP